MTGGLHYLKDDLDFQKEPEMGGSGNGIHRTVIDCQNRAGLLFDGKKAGNRNNTAYLFNLTFKKCSKRYAERPCNSTAPGVNGIALCFCNTSYRLENVTVSDTNGHGLYVRNSNSQEIYNCEFFGKNLH